jgi:hypothetical protein
MQLQNASCQAPMEHKWGVEKNITKILEPLHCESLKDTLQIKTLLALMEEGVDQ